MPTRPLTGLILLVCLAIAGLTPSVAAAQTGSSIEFIDITAEADFPNSISFSLAARSDVEVQNVQLFWRAVGSSAHTLAEPEFTVGDIVRASYQADMSVRYLPPGLDIEYFWHIIDNNGQVHESPTATILYMDERFEWQSLEGGLLSVWWYAGSEDYAATILNAANRTLIRLDEEYGLQADEHIRIIVYGDDRDFDSALPPNSADWIGGVAYSPLNHIIAQIAPGGNPAPETSRMIPHEVSHVVVHQASRNPYNTPPPWIDEGLATYVQETDDGRLDPILDRAVREGRLIPLGALRSSFPADPDQALLSYAESHSVIAYLVETFGTDVVGELVSIYREDVSHDQAVESVLEFTIEELDARWKASLGYEGDRPTGSASSSVDLRKPLIIGSAITVMLVVAASVVIIALWRTRTYREVEDEAPENAIQDQSPRPQP